MGENIPVPKLVQLPRLPVTEAAELVKSCEARSSPPDHLTQLQCWLKAMVPSMAMRVVTGPSERSVQSGTVDLTDLKHCLNTRRTEPLLMKAAVNNCF